MPGPDRHPALTHLRVVQVEAHEHHAGAPGRAGRGHLVREVVAQQHERGSWPRPPGRAGVGRHLDLHAGRSGQPQQVVDQPGVGGGQQRPGGTVHGVLVEEIGG
ncbi:MAG TPA: hypothetical protein VIM19_05990 [Actinomycetes bacterium]